MTERAREIMKNIGGGLDGPTARMIQRADGRIEIVMDDPHGGSLSGNHVSPPNERLELLDRIKPILRTDGSTFRPDDIFYFGMSKPVILRLLRKHGLAEPSGKRDGYWRLMS